MNVSEYAGGLRRQIPTVVVVDNGDGMSEKRKCLRQYLKFVDWFGEVIDFVNDEYIQTSQTCRNKIVKVNHSDGPPLGVNHRKNSDWFVAIPHHIQCHHRLLFRRNYRR